MKIKKQLAFVGDALLSLAYPKVCPGCKNDLFSGESQICMECLYKLPRTNFHTRSDNPASQMFWGRVKIEKAASFFFFDKGGLLQNLIHELKYKGNRNIGYELGKEIGKTYQKDKVFDTTDCLVPVPLHPKRLRERGYNQSFWIAKGIGEMIDKKVQPRVLYRKTYSQTQTRKSRNERWQNVESIFEVRSAQKIQGKHLLLIDDVLTTGSTLDACATTLKNAADCQISIATLAMAH